MKDENITLIPALPPNEGHGWLDIASEGLGLWTITNWHWGWRRSQGFVETLTIKRLGVTKEVYSFDEGETFTFEAGEH
jgi:hypothetical protein|tara:strand:+ start:2237 stop:2470 length:234 start_codon:yes stop_codon:yes gene_type:complete